MSHGQFTSGVVAYLDKILITGPTAKEHLKSLETVLKRLMEAGIQKVLSPSVHISATK